MVLSLTLSLLFAAACAPPGSAPAPAADPPPPAATAPVGAPAASIASDTDIATADELLDRLERAADDIRDLKADVFYEKIDGLTQGSELRTGRLIFKTTGPEDRHFAILFDKLYLGDRLDDKVLEHFVFSGRWMAEYDHARKQFIKREIVPPGKTFDPLKLGEGPFPLPIGQPKSEVLSRFTAELIAAPGPDAPKQLQIMQQRYPDAIGLRLTPKPGTDEAKDTAFIDVYYDRATLLPVGVNMIGVGEPDERERRTVRLAGAQRNTGIDAADLDKLKIETPDPKIWTVDVQPWGR